VQSERDELLRQVRAEKLVYNRLVEQEKARRQLEQRAQEIADRTGREAQKYGVRTELTMDRAGIRMYSVSDRGASTLRTIEQMAPQTLPSRIVRSTTDGSVIIPIIHAPHNSGNINVGGVQQVFESGFASAYEKAPSSTPAPAPRVEAPTPAVRVTPTPAPKPPVTRITPPAGSLE
jgi:hypothetical protein